MSLSKTVALVTGGGSGLGAAAVKCLLEKGARGVVVGDLSEQRFREQHSELLTDDDKRLSFCSVDVTKPDTISDALNTIEARYGQPLNAAINSAGVATAMKTLNSKGLPHKTDDFVKALTVNTVGSFHVARLAAERMQHLSSDVTTTSDNPDDLKQSRGCIVQTASIAAYEGQVGQIAYAASKAAIVGMTLPMARDLAPHGIRVVTVAPGLFATPLLAGLPEKVQEELGATVPCPNRLGHPREYGQLVAHILENQMLNGCVLRLDGALRMPP